MCLPSLRDGLSKAVHSPAVQDYCIRIALTSLEAAEKAHRRPRNVALLLDIDNGGHPGLVGP
ncbi:MAG: hypothetical protein ACI9DF_005442 [Verrucomicrobiales bacterium]|jgi:hypothetical protein